MTYEEYLDEVTTLIYEEHDVTEAQAIELIIAAQDADFFVRHDENPALRNQAQAVRDAEFLYTNASQKTRAIKTTF